MKKTLRILAFLLTIILLANGCSKQPNINSTTTDHIDTTASKDITFVLPYTNADGFNPFLTSNNLTLQNSNLIFTKLVYITPDFNIENGVCSSYTNTGLTVTLTANTNIKYSDGTSVSAEDITQSLNAAWQSAYYAGRFANVVEIKTEANNVVITLLTPDSMFLYLLDIPVMKASETASSKPTANGRYTYSAGSLKKNPYYDGKLPFDTISLTELSGYDALSGSLSLGNISFYSSEKETDSYGINVARQNYYRMNNLVFIGINGATYEGFVADNSNYSFLKTPQGRKIINDIIDKQVIVEKAYYSRGIAATGAINPIYPNVFEKQVLSQSANTIKTSEQLAAMDYKQELDGYWYDKNNQKLSLRLLCYSGSAYKRYVATLVQSQLANFGIEIVLDEVDNFEQYTQKVTNGDFDMYIGDVKLYNNMDISPFFSDTGALRSHLQITQPLLDAYGSMRESQANIQQFENAFAENLPYIPLLWRNGTICYTKDINGLVPSISDVFYGLEDINLDIEE